MSLKKKKILMVINIVCQVWDSPNGEEEKSLEADVDDTKVCSSDCIFGFQKKEKKNQKKILLPVPSFWAFIWYFKTFKKLL